MTTEFTHLTEVSGDDVSHEQVQRLCNRYVWASEYCHGKKVVEVGCGSGQSLGLLSRTSRFFAGGDYSAALLGIARQHYRDRIPLCQLDAQRLPFHNHSLDILILFEAIYYLEDAAKFVAECRRILRPGGYVLLASANKDLYDFNPSPNSSKYYGVVELEGLFASQGFGTEFFGDTPIKSVSIKQKIIRPIKMVMARLNLIPKTMAGKKFLKKIVFGNLVKMPAEITLETCTPIRPQPIREILPNRDYKVIFCAAIPR